MLTIYETALKQLGCCFLASNSLKALGRQYLQISAFHFSSINIIHWQQQLQARRIGLSTRWKGGIVISVFFKILPHLFQMFFNNKQSLQVILTHICTHINHLLWVLCSFLHSVLCHCHRIILQAMCSAQNMSDTFWIYLMGRQEAL